MDIHIHGDRNGFSIALELNWQSYVAFVKAMIATIATVATLLGVPHLFQLLTQSGW